MENITEAAKAAARNWPSIAMFTTPARSDKTPASTPNSSGVEYANVRFSWLVRTNGTAEDAAAQTTKPERILSPAITPAAVRKPFGSLPIRNTAPAAKVNRAKTSSNGGPGTSMVGNCTSAKASDRAMFPVGLAVNAITTSSTPSRARRIPAAIRVERPSGDSTTSLSGASAPGTMMSVLMPWPPWERSGRPRACVP